MMIEILNMLFHRHHVFLRTVKNSIFAIVIALLIASCSEYNKVLKSTDTELKYTKAVEYFNKGEYYKSLPIFEELIGVTRGSQRAEDVQFYFARCQYGVQDYYLANYYLKTFAKSFPSSPRSEECLFLAAECSYNLSPGYTLDQTETRSAIDEYQLFLDQYPGSHLKDSASHRIETLSFKLEKKKFEIARQYATTMRYNAAVMALNDFLKEYPASKYREEAMYLIVKSRYEHAIGSIESKKMDRLRLVSESFHTFANSFPESEMLKDAESYQKKAVRELARASSETVINSDN
jgi:outer membrane protein assembly factor BamD